ncbi:MAG: hypothetical protein AAFY91_05260 [Bacteroidota bacterium]
MGTVLPFLHTRLTAPRAINLREDGTLGIENSKLVITILVTFFTDLLRAIKTGNIGAILSTLLSLISYGNLISLAETAWNEIKDTSLDEAEELRLHFNQTLELENEETERMIEFAVSIVPQVYSIAIDALSTFNRVQALIADIRQTFGGIEDEDPVVNARVDQLLAAA